MKRLRSAWKKALAWCGPMARWLASNVGVREVNIYGGLVLLGLGLWLDFGAYAFSVPGAVLAGIGIFGIAASRQRGDS